MGTPPPTTRGVAHAEFTDFVPGKSVGHTLYNEGKNVLESWVKDVYDETGQKVDVMGQSLGGGLAFRLRLEIPEVLGKIYTFNAPKLRKSESDAYEKKLQTLRDDQKPELSDFIQPEEKSNLYEAHIRGFLAQKNVIVLKLNKELIEELNSSRARRIANIAAEILKVPFFLSKGTALGLQIIKHNLSEKISHSTTRIQKWTNAALLKIRST